MRIALPTRQLLPTLLLAALAAACQAPPPQCPETPADTRPPETPENHAQAVRELFALMDMPKVLETTIDTMLAAQLQANPNLVPFAETMQQFLKEHMSWESLEDEYVELYMEAFSQREVEDMVAFYQTPTGQKAIEKMPELMQQGAEIGRVRMRAHIGELQEKLKERVEELENGPQPEG